MITCATFQARFESGSEDAAVLEHLRSCDACLDSAAHVDPDAMFRALGGEMTPPGGVDAFTDDVMRAIHVRDTERKLDPSYARKLDPSYARKLDPSLGRRIPSVRTAGWPRRMAVAAMLAAGFLGVLVFRQPEPAVAPAQPAQLVAAGRPVKLATKPVVESYESANATILEVPTDAADDTRIVMVFDESLPADL